MIDATYIVMEVQTSGEGVTSTLINAYNNKNQAENKYYTILAAAAVSNVFRHGAFMFLDTGTFVQSKIFEHEIEPETESEI